MIGRSDHGGDFLYKATYGEIWEQKKDPHMVIIELEMAHDKVARNVMWWATQENIICEMVTYARD
jgi:hypothetical protein